MRRNSGIIGPIKDVTNAVLGASGIHDTFDAYNWRKDSKWPLSFRYVSLSPDSGTINENTSTAFTFTTSGFESTTTLYWTILHGTTTSSDFFGSVVSGSFNQGTNNLGGFAVNTTLIGNTGKTTRTFQIQIREGSTSGTVRYTSGTFSIPAITSTVTWSTSPVNEGSSSNLQVTLGSCGTYTTYTASISYSGTATSGDFSGGFPSTMTIGGGTYTSTFTAIADSTTEGTESVTATVSYGGFTLGNPTLSISDTSTAITATVTPTASNVNEGSSVTFNISITSGNFASGTLYWTLSVSGAVTNGDFSSPANAVTSGGSVAISSSAGSVTFTLSSDLLTESAAESFQFQLRSVSTSGTIIQTSSSVTINDTSQGSANNPTRTDFPTAGRAAFSWNRSSSNTTYEIPTGWTYTFPAGTPTGFYYLVVWNDYSTSNTSPTASTSYRTRRVFSLHVVSSYDFANRIATASNLTTVTGSGGFERIQGVRITNTTRSQLMVDVTPGSTVDVQYHTAANTVMVVPGDTITISVLLQGPYSEWANWTHNAE